MGNYALELTRFREGDEPLLPSTQRSGEEYQNFWGGTQPRAATFTGFSCRELAAHSLNSIGDRFIESPHRDSNVFMGISLMGLSGDTFYKKFRRNRKGLERVTRVLNNMMGTNFTLEIGERPSSQVADMRILGETVRPCGYVRIVEKVTPDFRNKRISYVYMAVLALLREGTLIDDIVSGKVGGLKSALKTLTTIAYNRMLMRKSGYSEYVHDAHRGSKESFNKYMAEYLVLTRNDDGSDWLSIIGLILFICFHHDSPERILAPHVVGSGPSIVGLCYTDISDTFTDLVEHNYKKWVHMLSIGKDIYIGDDEETPTAIQNHYEVTV